MLAFFSVAASQPTLGFTAHLVLTSGVVRILMFKVSGFMWTKQVFIV
jgi:hypothetical protein